MKHMQKFAPHRDNELNLVELSVVAGGEFQQSIHY